MTTKRPHIEIILPIYNEIENIPVLLSQLDETVKSLKGEASVSYLFVNDGSKDGSKELLTKLYSERSDIRVIHLIHNFGHPAALTCALEHFEGDLALIMDADLQDSPEALTSMFEAWKNGATTVVAERGKREETHSYLFKTFHYLLKKSSRDLPPISFGTHSLIDKAVVNRMRKLKERNRYFPGLIGFSSSNITPIRIDRHKRQHGSSRVGTLRLINLAVTAFLSFSNVPIRLVSIFGITLSGGAVLFGLSIVYEKLFTTKAIPGWASTVSLIAFSTGAQLLCLGLIGEYIARIYEEVKDRPIYLVDEILEKNKKAASLSSVA